MRSGAVIAASLLPWTGCATIYSQICYWECREEPSVPLYAGMQMHVTSYVEGEGFVPHAPVWFIIPDFPFSLVADTTILPMTLVQTIGRLAGLYPTRPSAERDAVDPYEWTRAAGSEPDGSNPDPTGSSAPPDRRAR
jgi:uncharacterized protein YceK